MQGQHSGHEAPCDRCWTTTRGDDLSPYAGQERGELLCIDCRDRARADQECGNCRRALPLVPRVWSPPNPRWNPRTLSRCTICWLLDDLDRVWTEDYGPVPREVMDAFAERLGEALFELRSFRAAPPGWAAPPESATPAATSSSTQTADAGVLERPNPPPPGPPPARVDMPL